MKKLAISLLTAALLSLGTLTSAAETAPKSVIDVVTVSWKAEATPEQIQAALNGVKALAESFEGITRVWTKTIKAQGDRTHAFVMEFADEASLKAYGGSDQQKKWYELYLPIRDRSTTFDITN